MERRILLLRRLGVLSVALTMLLMVLGAWVKANGAGLSCPDWPACYGKLLPPFPSYENGGTWHGQPVLYTQAQELYEWGHRAVVSLLVVPLAAFAIVAVSGKGLRPALRWLPVAAVGLYFFQAFLGAVTVLVGNKPWATTAHLATAVAFLTTQLVATCAAFFAPTAAARPAAEPSRPAPSPMIVQQRAFTGYSWPEPAAAAPAPDPEAVAVPAPTARKGR
jgi:cytochrome c oxidase assembly protein subunit 15